MTDNTLMQDKTIDHRLAWLAGIIDGEGWLGMRFAADSPIHSAKRSGKQFAMAAWYVAVCNTDNAMLSEIMSIADILGIRAKLYWQTAPKSARHKLVGRVQFQTKDSVRGVLAAVLPYLVTKRARAELMLRALEHRARQPHCRKPGYVNAAADQPFVAMMAELKELNRRGPAPRED